MSTRPTSGWRVRREETTGEGRPIRFARLAEQVAAGAWHPNDQVFDPRTGAWTPIGDHPELEQFLPRPSGLRRRPEGDAEMDITPMIDVTFQLIIFFMITATFVVQKTMDMPRAEAAETDARWRPTWDDVEHQYVVVRLAGDRSVSVDGEPVAMADLEDALRASAEKRDVVEMALTVDDQTRHALVVDVLDAAAGAQIERVHFTRPEPAESAAR
jgi:biopolymer transport protein ExbD